MGWFIGISGRNQELKESVRSLAGTPAFNKDSDSLFLLGGGYNETTYFSNPEDQSSGWIASGTGISLGPNPQLLKQSDWREAIQKGHEHLHQLNGHFAVAKFDLNSVELTTDQLGIRNIFIHRGTDFVLFSTRLDWVKKLAHEASINWKKFGSRWLSINQFSGGSFVDNIERISQGGHAIINENGVHFSNKRWNLKSRNVTTDQVKESLYGFTDLALDDNRPLSIGLSGGIDSRTIFAALLRKPEANWRLHTFGDERHPDIKKAIALNHYYQRKHYLFFQKMPKAHELESLIGDYIGQTMLTASPENLIPLQAYEHIQKNNLAVIDGGLGEVGRRRYLVGLFLKDKQAILDQDIKKLLHHFFRPNADIFTPECSALMESGMKEEFTQELEAMPNPEEIGVENWLDLFSIRTRVLNTGGPEQSRSDSYFMSYMPFIQPEFIRGALSLPPEERKNAKLFRSIIKDHAPKLQKVSLIKGDYSYPYWMKDISSSVWMRVKKKMGMKYESSLPVEFLLIMEEYVRDLYNSKSAKEFSGYDQKKIGQLITSFYDEQNYALAYQLNWWLAFEVFRRI